MSLTFYHAPYSTASLTEAVIAALKVPHEVKTVDLRGGETKTAEFLKINPNGKVPVLVHDGEVIWESAAITIYLGETFGVDAGLWPAKGKEKGAALKWTVWGNVTLAEAAARFMNTSKDPTANATANSDLLARLAVLNGGLEGRDFLLGSNYSLVDAHMYSIVEWITMMSIPLTSAPAVAAWAERCKAKKTSTA